MGVGRGERKKESAEKEEEEEKEEGLPPINCNISISERGPFR